MSLTTSESDAGYSYNVIRDRWRGTITFGTKLGGNSGYYSID